MTFPCVRARNFLLAAAFLAATPRALPQQKPLVRQFAAPSEEHYQVTLTLKAESHSVTTETVAAQTYVTPVTHAAEATVRWRSYRRILSVQKDGSAEMEETVEPLGESCSDLAQSTEEIDAALQASLKDFCALWSKHVTFRYSENQRGLLHEVAAAPAALVQLGEAPPNLLALWLRRAVCPNVIFPELNFEVGAKSQQSFRPANNLLKDARGMESAEWLVAPGDRPAATLHTVQQLAWISSSSTAASSSAAGQSAQKDESFFADSLTTLALDDGSVLHGNRTASRSISRHVDPVPGLPRPPDFSSKLTLSITIERLP
jgi:hypothetical protein